MQLLALALTAALAQAAPQDAAPAASPAAAREEPAARALWDAVVAAAVGDRKQRVTAFVLDFDATRYSGENQSNDVGATYSYLDPGYVRMRLAKTGRERMRGPEGDWLIDKAGAHRLVGRDFKQDIAELDESVAVARTFAHLTDPRGLRLDALRKLDAPPAGLPAKLVEVAGQLDWLRLESRDLRGPQPPGAERRPADVLELGVARDTRVPRIALLTYPPDPAHPERAPDAMALHLEGSVAVDGFRVPEKVTTWRLDPALRPPAFPERQALDMWFVKGSLAPQLTRDDFVPPR